jgi:hypothetical protein
MYVFCCNKCLFWLLGSSSGGGWKRPAGEGGRERYGWHGGKAPTPSLADRRAFVTRVGGVGESKGEILGVSCVASSYATGTLFRSLLGKVYILLLMLNSRS